MMQHNAVFLGLSLLFGTSQYALVAECSAKSVTQTVPLLELYTSEGCSSCPPADKWMSGIRNDKVTPLAFHVDYWDYLDGKDTGGKISFPKPNTATDNAKLPHLLALVLFIRHNL